MKNSSLSLSYYQSFSQRMMVDVERLSLDNNFVLNGGEIRTAVDFTELYSYTKQVHSNFLSKFGDALFGTGAESTAIIYELHESIMHFYFFEYGTEVYLLDTFKPELNSFIRSLANSQIEAPAIGMISPEEILELQRQPEFEEILTIRNRLNQGGRLMVGEALTVQKYLEENIPSMLALVREDSGSTRARLAQAMKGKGKVRILHNLAKTVGGADEQTFQRWFKELNDLRPDKRFNNRIDARAISLIYSHNRKYFSSDRRRKLILVSRSEHMHEIASRDFERGFWRDLGGVPLRHPRGSLLLLNTDAKIEPIGSKSLSDVLKFWSLILKPDLSVGSDRFHPRNSNHSLKVQEEIGNHFQTLESAWRDYCGVSFQSRALARKQEKHSDMLSAIQMITDKKQYKKIVRDRLENIGEELLASSLVVGTVTSRDMAHARQIMKQHNGSKIKTKRGTPDEKEKAWLTSAQPIYLDTSNGTSLPFSVYSTYKRGINLAEEIRSDPIEFVAAMGGPSIFHRDLKIPKKSIKNRVESEWYLLYSYACAATGAWSFAQHAADIAMQRVISISKAKHEFELQIELSLMLLRCRRHTALSAVELNNALSEFVATKSAWPTDVETRERFVAEQKKVELLVEVLKGDAMPHAQEHLEFYDEKIQFCKGGDFMEALIANLNNKIYHLNSSIYSNFVNYSLSELEDDLELFSEKLIQQFGAEVSYWPDNYVDTIAIARLRLYRENYKQCMKKAGWRTSFKSEVLSPLALLKQREYVSLVDQQDFRRHYSDAKKFYGAN